MAPALQRGLRAALTSSLLVGGGLTASVLMATTVSSAPIYSVIGTIPVGNVPGGVAVDPSSHAVYIANAGSNSVSVVDESGDAANGTVTATIPVGVSPSGVAVDPTTHAVYVANFGSNYGLGSVSVIDESGDVATGTVTATIPLGSNPIGVALDPSTHAVYVTDYYYGGTNSGPGAVSVIDESGDATTGTVTATIGVGNGPEAVAVDLSTHAVYVTNNNSGSVSVIDESGDATSGTVTATVPLSGAFGVTVDPSTHLVYVTSFGLGSVSVIDESGDTTTGTVISVATAGYTPTAVAEDLSTHMLYVGHRFADSASLANSVSVIDESGDSTTGTVVATIGVGTDPEGVAVDPATHTFYVTNSGSGTVSVVRNLSRPVRQLLMRI